MKKRLIVITGPTASGKSALAVELATERHTEIISADSRQVYRGIPISTAVPTLAERGGIPHHLLEFLSLESYYSAALFEEQALSVARRLWKEGQEDVVVCGGSMLYIDALCHGIDALPTVPEEVRGALAEEWRRNGDDWLREEALRLDPQYCAGADMSNLKRLFHAVEITRVARQPYSSLLGGQRVARDFEIIKIVLDLPREELFSRINRRVIAMADAGLLDEARSVSHLRHLNSLNTVGLKEMFRVIDGEWDMEFALARMAKNTRVYAKKQLTWHRRDPQTLFLPPTEVLPFLRNQFRQ